MRSSIAFLCVCVAALAAEPVVRPKLPADLERIAQFANASPSEFAADALLRVAAVTKVDRRLRMELIDRAFHMATRAQFHTPLTAIGQLPDTGVGMVASAAKLNLDTLSLQARAVRGMLELDKRSARQLFLEINMPTVEPRTCDQVLVPDASALYDVLAAVANNTFTEQERQKEEHINLVLTYMSRALLTPALQQMIQNLNVTSEQRDILTARLGGLRPAEPACPTETKSTKASEREDAFWKSEHAKRLFEGGIRLRSKENGNPYTSAERDSDAWYQRLTDYMKDLADWRPSDEKDEATYFHQKAIVYEMLVELIPRGRERDNAIQSYVDFVANSNLQREKPVEWFFHAQSLVTRIRNLNQDEAAKITAAFENSGNPVLLLYTELERQNLSHT